MAVDIPVDDIEPNPNQPRKTFPDDYIRELAASIEARGLLQAINVRPQPMGRVPYMIIAGECRWRAHVLLRRATIPSEIKDVDENEMQLLAIIENLQRHDMNPIDEANGYQLLIDRGYAIDRIVAELATSHEVVGNRLKLLALEEPIQQLVASGQLSPAMGSAISWVARHQQTRLVREIAAGKLRTVEQVRHAAIALREAEDQLDAFGELPKASSADVASLSRLESRIENIASVVQAGFKDGECVAAQRVSPDRVTRMADLLALIRKHSLIMEHELRRVATQTTMKLEVFAEPRHKERRNGKDTDGASVLGARSTELDGGIQPAVQGVQPVRPTPAARPAHKVARRQRVPGMRRTPRIGAGDHG
jgi:ParB/RepB/Spo0J family partition protein